MSTVIDKKCFAQNKPRKPDMSVSDFVFALNDSPGINRRHYKNYTSRKFTLLGQWCIYDNRPVRFFKLMEAAKRIFARPYMTVGLYKMLMNYHFVSNKEMWNKIRKLSYYYLPEKDKV